MIEKMGCETSSSNWERLKYRVPILLDGFNPLYSEGKPIDPSGHVQLQLNDKSFQENYIVFKERVLNSIGKEFLPVYRMADGEFLFIKSLERKELTFFSKINRIKENLIGLLKSQRMYGREMPKSWKEQLMNILDPYYFRVAHNESYTINEQKTINVKFVNNIRYIFSKGLGAIHFVDFIDGIHHPYFETYKSTSYWFDKYHINFCETNYTSFYYVYALLTGNDRKLILRNKNLLIITYFDENKMENLLNYLVHIEKATSVDFYKISATKSMFDKIDLQKITKPVDVVLVAAGIGSANILCQLQELNTLCIDAGIIIETFINPQIRKDRIFLLPTYEMNGEVNR